WYRAVDKTGVTPRHGIDAKAQTVHDAGTKVFNDDVSAVDETLSCGDACRCLEIQGDAPLATVEERLCRVLPARTTGRVEVYHVCDLITEHDGGQRPRDVLAKIDDTDAIQGACHGHLLSCRTCPAAPCVPPRHTGAVCAVRRLARPELLAGDASALSQCFQLRPDDFLVANPRPDAAVCAGLYVFSADTLRVVDQTLGDQLRVLDKIG